MIYPQIPASFDSEDHLCWELKKDHGRSPKLGAEFSLAVKGNKSVDSWGDPVCRDVALRGKGQEREQRGVRGPQGRALSLCLCALAGLPFFFHFLLHSPSKARELEVAWENSRTFPSVRGQGPLQPPSPTPRFLGSSDLQGLAF